MPTVEIDANGWRFTARTDGPPDGRPVLLLHGFPETSRSFAAQIGALADAGWRVVAPDQRGYSPGARPEAVEAYRVTELVADVLAVADACGMNAFDLVGHDWGGIVAWAAACLHPERVRSLTAISTPHPRALAAGLRGGDPEQAERSSYIHLFRQPEVPEALLLGEDGSGSGLVQLYESSGLAVAAAAEYVEVLTRPGAMTAALNWYRANDLASYTNLGQCTVPTMYVWSTDDVALGRGVAEGTASWVTGPYRFVELEGVSHWIPEAVPDELNRLLLEHLAAQG
jgi:pimeloyl-ACP methyl ester carboxylesterase